MISVQIVDDHKMLLEGLCRLINESGRAGVNQMYYTLQACRKGLCLNLPDVLLLDVHLPDGNGVDFCAEVKALYPELKILMLTSLSESSIVKRSLHNGAKGYILKNATSEEVIAGITAVHQGERFLCKEVDLLMKGKKQNEIVWLTAREKEVLRLIADGLSNPEIADCLFLSQETVKGYRRDLLLKFGAKNSVALVKAAMEQKLV
ncbi:MAG: response regulator transcription factor [Candidatus Azobacteroides sp.]|nr:response regulator transcription factor [Candidatus Azobacteroides sp.]